MEYKVFIYGGFSIGFIEQELTRLGEEDWLVECPLEGGRLLLSRQTPDSFPSTELSDADVYSSAQPPINFDFHLDPQLTAQMAAAVEAFNEFIEAYAAAFSKVFSKKEQSHG